jgi:hypothetical protein
LTKSPPRSGRALQLLGACSTRRRWP